MTKYKNDIISYVESNGGKSEVSAQEVADSVGCTTHTVYRHWSKAGSSEDTESGGIESESESELEDTESGGIESESESGGIESESESGGIESESESELEDTGEDLEIEDNTEDSRDYDCAECGESLEYLETPCPECGKTPAWSHVE